MNDNTEKMIDYYERSRNEVVSPWSSEYDDLPWQARVDMARNSQWLERSRERQHEPIDAEFTEQEPVTVAGVLLVGSFVALVAIAAWGFGYILWDVWTSDVSFTEKLFTGAVPPLAFVFMICMMIVVGDEKGNK